MALIKHFRWCKYINTVCILTRTHLRWNNVKSLNRKTLILKILATGSCLKSCGNVCKCSTLWHTVSSEALLCIGNTRCTASILKTSFNIVLSNIWFLRETHGYKTSILIWVKCLNVDWILSGNTEQISAYKCESNQVKEQKKKSKILTSSQAVFM